MVDSYGVYVYVDKFVANIPYMDAMENVRSFFCRSCFSPKFPLGIHRKMRSDEKPFCFVMAFFKLNQKNNINK